MQITIARTELAAAWAWAVKGLPKRAVLPILDGIKLTVDGGTLTLETFDFERAQRTRVNGTDSQPGVICVAGPDLKKVIAAFPKSVITEGKNGKPKKSADFPVTFKVAQVVTAEATEDVLTIGAAGAVFTLGALPVEEYPLLPEVPDLAGTLFGKDFARSAVRVARAAGTDDTLRILTGVCFRPSDGALVMAATDRYRLAVDEVPWTRGDSAWTELVVPAKPLADFAAKAGTADKVQVFISDQQDGHPGRIRFADDTRELIINGLHGQFIRYEGRIPTQTTVNALVDAPALAAAIKQLTPLVGRNEAVQLDIDAEAIKVTALSDGKPVASLTVPGTADFHPFMFRANPAYLTSLLLGFDGQAWLGINSGSKPFLLHADGDSFRAIQVPIRVIE